jgi:hypothetical protein
VLTRHGIERLLYRFNVSLYLLGTAIDPSSAVMSATPHVTALPPFGLLADAPSD